MATGEKTDTGWVAEAPRDSLKVSERLHPIGPREALAMDPQLRVPLEGAW
jgi:hypothetical protein